jgi:transcriptional regulator with XRE-family HTH domain
MGIKNIMLKYAEQRARCKCCCHLEEDFVTEAQFEERVIEDLDRARGRIIIRSAYLTMEGTDRFQAAIIRARARGVVVCLYVQEPNDWWCREGAGLKFFKIKKLKALEEAIAFMQSLGVHVNLVKGIHEKVVIVDDQISYFGSLNMTSYTGETGELMERKISARRVRALIEILRLEDCEHCCSHLGYRTLILNPDATQLHGPKNMKSSEYTRLIGHLVHRIRKERNLSKEQLSELSGVSVNTIKKLEDGYNVSRDTAQKICVALSMPLQPVPHHLVPGLLQYFCKHKECSEHKCLGEYRLGPAIMVETQHILASMRRDMELGQEEASTVLGMSQPQLCELETGASIENLNKAQDLVSAYGLVLVPVIATTPAIEAFLSNKKAG